MKPEQSNLLRATPLLIAAIATNATAQEVSIASQAMVPRVANETTFPSDITVVPLSINIPTAGTYVFTVPAGKKLTVSLDGEALLSPTAEAVVNAEPLRAFTNLTAGEHLIEVKGAELATGIVSAVSLHLLGAQPESIAALGHVLTLEQAETLLEKAMMRTAVLAIDDVPVAETSPQGTRQTFEIGGGSTASRSSAAEGPLASGTAPTKSVAEAASGVGVEAAPSSTSTSRSTGVGGLVLSGAQGTVGTVVGASGGSREPGQGSGTGSPVSSPTPVPTPNPPAPTPNPTMPARPVVVSSPLTPPSDVPLTQMVQLTVAGNEDGIVPNSGTTLFGAVQDTGAFDIVNVQLSNGRQATVDVGSMTGQFAVRLFAEDFAAQSDLTVTLTGANSANSEVQAAPVSYTVTGAPANDGLSQALGRLTFGPTPELYTRVRAMGFEAFVEEQLNPDAMLDLSGLTPAGRSIMPYTVAYQLYTDKQLEAVMAAFWVNHFHAVDKRQYMYHGILQDRDFYRDNALGTFGDLLRYSAHSPVMLYYLDNTDNRVNSINETMGASFWNCTRLAQTLVTDQKTSSPYRAFLRVGA